MFLKKLIENRLITIDFDQNGETGTIRGRVYKLNLIEQLLSVKDDEQNLFTIRLSGIRHIY